MAESCRETRRTTTTLPWGVSPPENRRFALILGSVFALFLPAALLIPQLDLPQIERLEAEKVPPSLARLVQPPKLPEPPKPVRQEPEPALQPKPETADAKAPKPVEVAAQQAPVAAKSKPVPKPVQKSVQERVEQAREKASRSGLLAMKNQLSSLRAPEKPEVRRFEANTVGSSGGQGASPNRADTLKGSGGVGAAEAPDAVVAVQGHRVKRVELAMQPSQQANQVHTADQTMGERAMSNIRQVFDAQKTALYSLYRRELRQDPTLAGKVMLELTIEPDGTVSACQVVSSELENQSLEQRIAMRVRLFNFGTEPVGARKVRFPIDFLPG